MRDLLLFAMLLLRSLPGFFRSRGEQGLVELALRQQLAAYTSLRCPAASMLPTSPVRNQPSTSASRLAAGLRK